MGAAVLSIMFPIKEMPERIILKNHTDLTDFVQERTCEWVWGEEWLESTPYNLPELQWANWYLNCGCWYGDEDELCDFDDPASKPTRWSFCPRCGAKVVQS